MQSLSHNLCYYYLQISVFTHIYIFVSMCYWSLLDEFFPISDIILDVSISVSNHLIQLF